VLGLLELADIATTDDHVVATGRETLGKREPDSPPPPVTRIVLPSICMAPVLSFGDVPTDQVSRPLAWVNKR
jgi:hypothetical protein